MSRINHNLAALGALNDLNRSNADMATSLERLAGGLRINRAADDPAGLIASEFLRSEIGSLRQAVDNSERAINLIGTAEGALNEVSALLIDVRELVVEAANEGGMVREEIEANQLQIDSAIESINRIANTSRFDGVNLLNGNLSLVTSGVTVSQIADISVNAAQFGTQANLPINAEILTAAAAAELQWQTSQVASTTSVEISGNEGTEVLTFVSGTAASAILFAVNQLADATGVSATYISAGTPSSGVVFNSREYGSRSFVSMKAVAGTFDVAGGSTRDTGTDVVAAVNGQLTVGDGLKITLNTSLLDLEMTVDSAVTAGDLDTFTITGGGALFQLGADVVLNQQANIGIQSITANNLGGDEGSLNQLATGGNHSLLATSTGHVRTAQRIVDQAIGDVSNLRGRLGAFQLNTLETNMNSLQVAIENLTSAESNIRDADFAEETARLTRNQVLVAAGTSVLTIANNNPQTVLSLLRG